MGNESNNKAKIINYSSGKSLSVRLRGKRLSNSSISLYLDYYQGYSKKEDGSLKTNRKIEYLKIYLTDPPKTTQEREKNKETLLLAQDIRSKRESDIKHTTEGYVAPFKRKVNFFDFAEAYLRDYKKQDIRMIKMAIRVFQEFYKDSYLKLQQIDPILVRGFRDYLLSRYNGETPNSVFSRFKKMLNAACESGLLSSNPGAKISCSIPQGINKEILTIDEIIALSKTNCPNTEVKRAFLFSLNTGLRFVDIIDLKYKHITNGKVKKSQLKTGREAVIDLNPNALRLLGQLGQPEEAVFNLPSFTYCLRAIKQWAKDAGIPKNITWHSARHSFATILLINSTDIKTVGNLLGHSKIEHTQKYTHVVDALKAKAVNTLPEIEITH